MTRHKHRYYMPEMQLLFQPREVVGGGIPKKGTENRRIIAKGEDYRREYFLHSTKGYRSYCK